MWDSTLKGGMLLRLLLDAADNNVSCDNDVLYGIVLRWKTMLDGPAASRRIGVAAKLGYPYALRGATTGTARYGSPLGRRSG